MPPMRRVLLSLVVTFLIAQDSPAQLNTSSDARAPRAGNGNGFGVALSGAMVRSNPGIISITTSASSGIRSFDLRLTMSDDSAQPLNLISHDNWITIRAYDSNATPA